MAGQAGLTRYLFIHRLALTETLKDTDLRNGFPPFMLPKFTFYQTMWVLYHISNILSRKIFKNSEFSSQYSGGRKFRILSCGIPTGKIFHHREHPPSLKAMAGQAEHTEV